MIRRTLFVCSFLSGAAALGYEVVWTNLLSLTFGGTRLATGAVLAGFLGGMGFGARFLPARLARAGAPLRAYAFLESGIAASAIGITLLLPHLPELVAPAARSLGAGGAFLALQFAIATLVLRVPSALLGATLPILGGALIRERDALARDLGPLYGLNTLGAAVGALVAGTMLIEAIGHRATVFAGAAVNALVAALALGAAGRGVAAPRREERLPPEAIPTTLPRGVLAAVLAVSGAATLGYEVVWFRAFSYLFGNSTYAFAVILFAFLAGLGIGPLFLRRALSRHPERTLALVQLGVALASLAIIAALAGLVGTPSWERQLSIFSAAGRERPWLARLALEGALGVGLLLPATTLMGLSFPLATSLYLGDVRRFGEGLGRAILLANLGSIAGALGGALVLLPVFGTVGGTRVLAAASAALGLLVLARMPGSPRARLSTACAAAAVGLAVVLVSPDRIHFAAAVPRPRAFDLVFEEEGDLATVQVWRAKQDPAWRIMAIDGAEIGASKARGTTTYAKQVCGAELPFALEPNVRDVLTVGLGSASTLAAIAAHPEVRAVDCVEINAPVVPAARLFETGSALDDPRVTVAVDDAMNYLLRDSRRYDAIVSDGKLAMSFAGTSKLLSREYYERCLERLTERGIFVQWVPLGLAEHEMRIIARTFAASFAHAGIFFDPRAQIFLAGSRLPLAGRNEGASEAAAGAAPSGEFAGPASPDLVELGLPDRETLLARWVAGRGGILATVGDGPRNTWDHPRLEFTAYKLPVARRPRESRRVLQWLEAAARADASSRESIEFLGSPAAAEMAAQRAVLAQRLEIGDETR